MPCLVLAVEFGLRVVSIARHLFRPANDLTRPLEAGVNVVPGERFVECGDEVVESLVRLNLTGNKQSRVARQLNYRRDRFQQWIDETLGGLGYRKITTACEIHRKEIQ